MIVGSELGFMPQLISWLACLELYGFLWETAAVTQGRARRGFGWYLVGWEHDWERCW